MIKKDNNKRKSRSTTTTTDPPSKKRQSLPAKEKAKSASQQQSASPAVSKKRETHVREEQLDRDLMAKASWESDVQTIKNIEKGRQGCVCFFSSSNHTTFM